MAIIQINSKDSNFGYIIKKNPNSGMQIRNIRKGNIFSWYSNEGTSYNILFKDADNEVSFGDQEFEYLDTSRYNSSLFVISAISELFSSTVRDLEENDIIGNEKSFLINMISIRNIKQIKHFQEHFNSFNIETELIAGNSYKVIVYTNESFHSLFNFMNLFMLFIVLSSDEYINLDNSIIEKYMSSIERLDAPFFIRYLFSRNMFKSKNMFNKYKDKLQNSESYSSIDMKFGDTGRQRKDFIENLLSFDKDIIDIGCGEGAYAIPFSQKIKENIYTAIDIEKKLTDLVIKKAIKKDIKNINVFNNIDEIIKEGEKIINTDVILTEVIEHMPKNDSIDLINKILNNIDFDNFIITVPNKEFNKFYMINDDEFRHDDHDWEPTFDEFKDLINSIIKSFDYEIEYFNIGDEVNGISTSIGCKISKKENKESGI